MVRQERKRKGMSGKERRDGRERLQQEMGGRGCNKRWEGEVPTRDGRERYQQEMGGRGCNKRWEGEVATIDKVEVMQLQSKKKEIV